MLLGSNLVRIKTCLINDSHNVLQNMLQTLIKKAGWSDSSGRSLSVLATFGSKKFTHYRNQVRSKVCLYCLQVYFYIGRSCVIWQLKSYVLQLYKMKYRLYHIFIWSSCMHVLAMIKFLYNICILCNVDNVGLYILLSIMYLYCKLK